MAGSAGPAAYSCMTITHHVTADGEAVSWPTSTSSGFEAAFSSSMAEGSLLSNRRKTTRRMVSSGHLLQFVEHCVRFLSGEQRIIDVEATTPIQSMDWPNAVV